MVFKLYKPITETENFVMRVREPIEALGTWNDTRDAIVMESTGRDYFFDESSEFETFQAFALIKQKNIIEPIGYVN